MLHSEARSTPRGGNFQPEREFRPSHGKQAGFFFAQAASRGTRLPNTNCQSPFTKQHVRAHCKQRVSNPRTCSIRTASLVPPSPRSNGFANASTQDTNSSVDTHTPPPRAPRPVRQSATPAEFPGQSSTTLIPNTVTPHWLRTQVARFSHKSDASRILSSEAAGDEAEADVRPVGRASAFLTAAAASGGRVEHEAVHGGNTAKCKKEGAPTLAKKTVRPRS